MIRISGAAIAVLMIVAAVLAQQRTTPRFARAIPWAQAGVWLKAETHVHTSFSDGGPLDAVIDQAVANSCDVLAITDHTDSNLKAATPEYHAAIAAARTRAPGLLILSGIEWNVPPGGGDDHAVVLFPPEMDDAAVTGEFKAAFDDLKRPDHRAELTVAAFDWLRTRGARASEAPVVFLNHPGRKAKDIAAVRTQIEWLSKIGPGVFAGVEGAPGHQNMGPIGAYKEALTPEDRWDPAIAPPGAAWDQLLARGTNVSGALATSDFHSTRGDYWPCQFSATWIYAPDRSPAGVLKALRAGSFVGVHGGIATHVQLSLTAAGLPRPAITGEEVRLAAGTTATVELQARVPATDWSSQPNRLDVVDLIGVTKDGASILRSGAPDAKGTFTHSFTIPAGGIVIRARGRRIVENGPDLMFHTNAIAVR
jgi:hypothetical protein